METATYLEFVMLEIWFLTLTSCIIIRKVFIVFQSLNPNILTVKVLKWIIPRYVPVPTFYVKYKFWELAMAW